MSNAISESTTKSKIMLDFNKKFGGVIYKSTFQKAGTVTAQLKQVFTTHSEYQGKRISTERNGNLFAVSEFGSDFKPKTYDRPSERVAWIDVPEGTTADQLQARLDKANENGAVIYRVLSNRPILSKDQLYSISAGQKTLDDYADSQIMKYPEGSTNGVPGTPILHEGKVQYRKTFFWPQPRPDEDHRGKVEEYRSPKIKAELEGAGGFKGQNIEALEGEEAVIDEAVTSENQ